MRRKIYEKGPEGQVTHCRYARTWAQALCALAIALCVVEAVLWHMETRERRELELKHEQVGDPEALRQELQDMGQELQKTGKELEDAKGEIRQLEEELKAYEGLPFDEKDWDVIKKVSEYISGSVNRNLGDSQVTKAVAACLLASKATGMPFDKVLALAHTESTFYEGAVSSTYCKGLMQLSRRIWDVYSEAFGVSGHDVHNPMANAVAGTAYLSALEDSYGGNADRALQHYNAGMKFNDGSAAFAKAVIARAGTWKKVIGKK